MARVSLYILEMAGKRRDSLSDIWTNPAPSRLIPVTIRVPRIIRKARGSALCGSNGTASATAASERSIRRLITARTTSALSA